MPATAVPPAVRSAPSEAGARARPRRPPVLRATGRGAAVAAIGVSFGTSAALARLRVPGARRYHARGGERVARRLDRLGGAYLKAGQVLSTRVDLLSDGQRASLARLCDQVTPRRPERSLAATGASGALDLDGEPFAAGSVTDVYLARRRDSGARVVVKILRRDSRARFEADLALIRGFTRLGSRLPLFASVPMVASVKLLADAVGSHLDLRTEAARQARLAEQLGQREGVVVPRPHLDLCDERVLVMDYVEGARRIDDPALDGELQLNAVMCALHALYDMLFRGGLVHCDMHPGNMLVSPAGDLVLLDFGYACELDDDQQTAFAQLFRAMALGAPVAVAAVLEQTATTLPDDLDHDALVADLRALVDEVEGNDAGQFNVAAFVTALFAVQRRHSIVASPGFTMGIVALMTLEGLLKQLTPTLDFQGEALPFVLERLALAHARDTAG